MAKRFTDTEKWKKMWIRTLPIEYKLFWLYILDDCNHAGIWDVDMDIANIKLGTQLTPEKTLKVFKGKIVCMDKGLKWFIPKFIEFQYGTLNPENRAHKSVMDILEKEGAYKGLITPLQGCKDMDKDMDKDKDMVKDKVKAFRKPTLEQVKDYCSSIQTITDPELFFDNYESTGWIKANGQPVKDWKATIRTWEKRNKDNGKSKVTNEYKRKLDALTTEV